MDLVFQFPGQSSRYPGMVPRIAGLRPENGDILAEASAVLGRDLAHHYRADNADAYACNRDIQTWRAIGVDGRNLGCRAFGVLLRL